MSKIGQWVFEQQEIEDRHDQPAPDCNLDFRDKQAEERNRQLKQMEVADDNLPF